jgi:hypothetical protein
LKQRHRAYKLKRMFPQAAVKLEKVVLWKI